MLTKINAFLLMGVSSLVLFSCVSAKKYKNTKKDDAEKYAKVDSLYRDQLAKNADCGQANAADKMRIRELEERVKDVKSNASEIMGQLKDLSVITGTQAESIKKSLDNIGVKDEYIKNLQSALNRKDSMNMALVINLKGAVGNLEDKDINIKVDKGVVYVDISDKLLFKSGSWTVTEHAKEVLGKVAKVLLSEPDIEFMVEGHTDNKSFKNGVLEDNWDLSVKRATSVVRILQDKYHVPPAHMTAAGRSEYLPVSDNDNKEGQAANRRTRIVILPQLDQFFKLLEKPKS